MDDTLRYEIVPASRLHIGPIVSRMGAEAAGVIGACMTPRQAVRTILNESIAAWTVLLDGRPVVMWGQTGSMMSIEANVWLVVTDIAREHVRTLVEGARAHLRMMLAGKEALLTTVLVTDTRALRWVKFLGFRQAPGTYIDAVGREHHFFRFT